MPLAGAGHRKRERIRSEFDKEQREAARRRGRIPAPDAPSEPFRWINSEATISRRIVSLLRQA